MGCFSVSESQDVPQPWPILECCLALLQRGWSSGWNGRKDEEDNFPKIAVRRWVKWIFSFNLWCKFADSLTSVGYIFLFYVFQSCSLDHRCQKCWFSVFQWKIYLKCAIALRWKKIGNKYSWYVSLCDTWTSVYLNLI